MLLWSVLRKTAHHQLHHLDIHAGDFDGDGRHDLAVGSVGPDGQHVELLRGVEGDSPFVAVSLTKLEVIGVHDHDHDGDDELLVVSTGAQDGRRAA